jgi:hypothetical protein
MQLHAKARHSKVHPEAQIELNESAQAVWLQFHLLPSIDSGHAIGRLWDTSKRRLRMWQKVSFRLATRVVLGSRDGYTSAYIMVQFCIKKKAHKEGL